MINKKEVFNFLLSSFEEETKYLSFTETKHPYYQAMLHWGKVEPDVVIAFLLEANKIDPSWSIHHLLFELVPTKEHPHVPEESRGVHEDIASIWLAWGKLKGYGL